MRLVLRAALAISASAWPLFSYSASRCMPHSQKRSTEGERRTREAVPHLIDNALFNSLSTLKEKPGNQRFSYALLFLALSDIREGKFG